MLQVLSFIALVGSSLADHRCQQDASCMAACESVQPSGCVAAQSCDPIYQHCACSGAAALRRDGGCKAAVIEEGQRARQCTTPTYEVVFTAAARATPDMRPEDFSTGELRRSTRLATVLLSSLGAAVERPLRDVLVSKTHLKLYSKSRVTLIGNSSSAPTMLFDIGFSFCLTGNASVKDFTLSELRSAAFERRFGEEAQHYAAMYPSTMRMLSMVRKETNRSEAPAQTHMSTGSSAPIAAEGDHQFVSPAVLWVAVVLMGAASCLCFFKGVSLMLERRLGEVRTFKDLDTDSAEVCEEGVDWPVSPQAIAVACVTQAFDPSEAAQVDARFESCLALSAGDLVEVHSTSGLWLYGRVHGSEPMGYFPEGHVSWIGQSLSGSLEGEVQGIVPTAQQDHGAWISQAFPCLLPTRAQGAPDMEQACSLPGEVQEGICEGCLPEGP